MFAVDVPLEAGETSHTISPVTVADAAVVPKYDDPYEENPVIAKCLANDTAEVTASDVVTETDCIAAVSNISTKLELSNCTLATGTDQPVNSQCTSVPMRSFELSAEYGGFFVPPAVNEQLNNKPAEDYTDKLVETAPPLPVASATQVPHADSGVGATGLYDEPWDLSTVKRSIEEQFHESSQKGVGRTVVDSCRAPTTDVYAQPHKGEKWPDKVAGSGTTDPRVQDGRSDGPSYGILCARLSDNGFMPPPPLARRRAGAYNNQPGTWANDLRPMDDYDIPWDQKKKPVGQTSK